MPLLAEPKFLAVDLNSYGVRKQRPGSAVRNSPIRTVAVAATALAMAGIAHARPVTYPGGRMSMTEVDGSAVATQIDYTLSRQLAVGAYALTREGGDRHSAGALANVLLMRKNTEDSQSNVYVMAGAGPSWVRRSDDGRDTVASGFVAAEADWETRRWFVGAAAKLSVVGGDAELGWRTRLGVAPYIADSGKLHTWTMLQVGRSAIEGREVEVTPLVRLFKGTVLAEAGVSHRGRAFGTLWFYF